MDSFIATEPGECATCLYDFNAGEEVGYVAGEINCDGCFERAQDATSDD